MTYIRDTAPLAEPVCDPFYEAVADWDDSLANLSRFLANERDRSAANLAPCACGHIALFCACPANPKPVEAVR